MDSLDKYFSDDICFLILSFFSKNDQHYLKGEWGDIAHGDKFEICHYAITFGFMDILKWATDNGEKHFDYVRSPMSNKSLCAYAALFNRIKILKWLRENNYPWDGLVYCYAAEEGNMEILEWALKNGCPKNDHAVSYATNNGHLECCKWLLDNKFPWDEDIIKRVVRRWPNIDWVEIYKDNEVII